MKYLFVFTCVGDPAEQLVERSPKAVWAIFDEDGVLLENGHADHIGKARINAGLGIRRPDLTKKYGEHTLVDLNNVPHSVRHLCPLVKKEELADAYRAALVSKAIQDS